MSKRDYYDAQQNYISLLESPSKLNDRRNKAVIMKPNLYIPMLASEIAKDDIHFRYSISYQNYIKNERFIKNMIRKNKSYDLVCISKNKVILNKNKKGFG